VFSIPTTSQINYSISADLSPVGSQLFLHRQPTTGPDFILAGIFDMVKALPSLVTTTLDSDARHELSDGF
jgi:hypothetical protein